MRSVGAEGKNQRRTGSMKRPVCSKENPSVEKIKITTAHTSAGHHERSHAAIMSLVGTRWRTTSRLGAGRGFRQGSVGDIQRLTSSSIVANNEGNHSMR